MHNRFRLAGVMGWPIAHSRSPKIHNYWLKLHGIEGAYAPFAVEPGKLGEALRALATLGMAGCNLTIPHKETALKLVDVVEDGASRIGAINCVVVGEDGRLTGKNYDGFGFIAALRAAAPGWDAKAAPAAVIGAGGGARAIVAGLLDAGATEIRVFNRTRERARRWPGTSAPRSMRMPGRIAIRASRARGCSSTPRARAWSASRRSRSTSPRCRLPPS